MKIPTVAALSLTAVVVAAQRGNNEIKILEGHTRRQDFTSPLPHEYISESALPKAFTWGDVDGENYLTHSLNQHLPQYCGSCWAHGSISALADRIKIARKGQGEEINLSIQFILNCGTEVAGSCHGGYHTSTYQFIKDTGYIPFDTCLPYLACSAESKEGFCEHVDTTCSALNTCKTCDTFAGMGGACTEIDMFPNATVAEYGSIDDGDVHKIMSEIYSRGPVAAVINAEPIVDYQGGVFHDVKASKETNHIVSIVGWDRTSKKHPHWIIRNSWGQYWGELGYVRVKMGHNVLGIESEIAWATPGSWTVKNFPCSEDGKNCSPDKPNYVAEMYVDPSRDVDAVQERLRQSQLKESSVAEM